MGEIILIVLMTLGLIVGVWNLIKAKGGGDLQLSLQTIAKDTTILAEKVQRIEGNQDALSRSIGDVRNDLTATGTNTRGLVETASVMRSYLADTKEKLGTLQTLATARQEEERTMGESVKRLEAIIAGTHSKGAAGENILDLVFSRLPADWQVRDFRVEGKVCEFGLRLPNKRIMPIDSKWTATHLLEQFMACKEVSGKQRIKAQIEKVVLLKAAEVQKYLDPETTAGFGIAVVPDAIYELCGATLCQVLELKVAVISHSMFIPYLLLVFQTHLKTSQDIDMQKLSQAIGEAEKSVQVIQEKLDGSFSRALNQLMKGRDDIKIETRKISQRLNSVHNNTGTTVPTATETDLSIESFSHLLATAD